MSIIENLEVKATTKILKYAEGADPNKDEPIGIVQQEYVFRGHEAIKLLNDQGISTEEAIKLGMAKQTQGGN